MSAQNLRRHLPALAAWTLLWGLFFGAFLAGGQQLAAGDLSGQFHAFALFQARELRAGRLPLWSPGSYGGVPFAADPQAAAFYPPRWLTILVAPSAELPFALLQFEALAHVWLAGILMYGLVYLLTRRRSAGLLAAVSLGLGGYLTGYPLLQMAILETIAWLPGALLAIHHAFEARRPAPWLVAAGLALALAALAGHPQTWMQCAYLAAAWFLARAIAARWPWRRVLGAGALVGLVALGVSAVGWFPALRYALHTARSNVDYAFVSSGLPLEDWIQALVPTTMSLWAPQYGGVAILALALVGWRLRDEAPHRRGLVLFWAGAALVSAWLALGDAGLLYRVAHRLLPGLGLFRQQERWLALWAVSLSILGGLGLAAWLDAPPPQRRRALAWTARLLAPLLAATLCLLALWRGSDQGWEIAWLRHAVLALAALGLLTLQRHRRLAAAALVLLLALDLYVVSLSTVVRRPPDPTLWARPAWLDELQGSEMERWDLTFLVYANWGEVEGLETVSGISPLRPAFLDELRRLPQERYWQLLNVRYVVSSTCLFERPGLTEMLHVPQGTLTNQQAEGWLYRVEETLPRAYMVYQAEAVADAESALERLRDPAWDPAASVVLLAAEAPALELTAPDRPPAVEAQRLDARTLAIRVDTANPGYLVISEWGLPGWQATLDGQPAPLLRANYAFQALHVPAGAHTVRLTYAAPDLLWGSGVSLAALAGALALALLWCPAALAATRRAYVWPRRLHLPALALGSRAERLLGGGLIVAALGLRLYALGRAELGADEAWAYLAAIRAPEASDLFRHSLYPLFLQGWMRLFGSGELALRLPSALAGAALVAALWRLGRRLAGPWGGLAVAGLAAIAPGLLSASRSADGRISLALLLLALATTWLLQARTPHAEAPGRAPALRWAAYAAASVLALGLWAPAGWAVLAHGAYLLAACARSGRWKELWAWAPLGAAGAWWATRASGVAWPLVLPELAAGAAPALRYAGEGLGLWIGGAGWGPWATAAMGVMALLLLAWFARIVWRSGEAEGALVLGWLAITVPALLLTSLGASAYRQEAILLAAHAWWCLAALGARRLWRRGVEPARIAALAALVALALLGALGAQRYLVRPVPAADLGYAALARSFQAEAQPDDPLLTPQDDPRWRYYLREATPQPALLPADALADEARAAETLEPLLAGRPMVWVALPAESEAQPGPALSRWLAQRALPVREIRGESHTLAAYTAIERAGDLLPVDGATYSEGGVTLAAVHLMVNGRSVSGEAGPVPVAAGDRLDVSLLWQAGGPTPRALTVFVHLVDDQGRLAAQHDGPPIAGSRPTTAWEPGETIVDRHTLTAPAEGAWQGQLLVGLYDSQTVVRESTQDGRDAISLYRVAFGDE